MEEEKVHKKLLRESKDLDGEFVDVVNEKFKNLLLKA